MSRDPQTKYDSTEKRVPRVRAVHVEYDDGSNDRIQPLEHGEIHLIFREGKLAEDQAIKRNKRF